VGDGIRTRDTQIHNLAADSPEYLNSIGLRLEIPSLAHQLPADICQLPPDLALIVGRWGSLPEAVRAGIVAMVKASSQDDAR
jgi:hypothetical protein